MCNEDMAQSQFTEHVNDRFHGCVICDGDWSKIQDPSHLQRG